MRLSSVPLLFLLPAFAASLSSLDRPRAGFLQDVLEAKVAHQNSCKPTGLIQDACCDFETVENVNDQLFLGLKELVATPFFRYHKVDLLRECPFWKEDGSCMNRACGVEMADEEHIPEEWRSHKLGALEGSDPGRNPADLAPSIEEDDGGFCVLEDEMDSQGAYVDLLQNPERFTGYAGASSSRVWKAIYEENCFTPVPFIDPATPTSEGGAGFASLSSVKGLPGLTPGAWGETEKRLMGSLAGPRDGGDEVCLEKRVFYRLISGLHASISIHICDEYLDQKTGLWSPNLECFITRIAEYPERLQNVYFSYVVLLRALSKSGPQLLSVLDKSSTGNDQKDAGVKEKMQELLSVAQGCPSTFDENSMFSGANSLILKTEFKSHFRNVSRIMDCVGCDKCRLWGKLQVTGLGTALKLLFSASDSAPPLPPSFPLHNDHERIHATQEKEKEKEKEMALSRGEVVAFVNTLHRFSESLAAVEKFRQLWVKRTTTEQEEWGTLEGEGEKVVRRREGEEEELSRRTGEGAPGLIVREETARVIREEEGNTSSAVDRPAIPVPDSSAAEATPSPPPPPAVPNISVPELPLDPKPVVVVVEEEGVVGKVVRICKEGLSSCSQVLVGRERPISDEL